MKAKLSIYAICFNMLIYLALSVSIAGAASAFPSFSETAIQYLLTIPSIACIAGTFLVPLLSSRLSQKTLSIAAQLVSLLGAAIYIVYPANLVILYIAGFIMGLAYGILATTFPLLVNMHIAEGKRDHVMGVGSGMVQFGRLTSLMIAGFLGEIRWNFVYFVYILVVVSLCISLPCLPSDKPFSKKTGKNRVHANLLTNRGIWFLAFFNFIFGIFFFMINTHISLYIEGYDFGGASTTGIITSFSCGLAGIVACMFSTIYGITKKNTLPLIFCVLGIGYVAAGGFISLPTIIFGALCGAIAASVFTPYILVRASEVVTPEMLPMAVSIAVAFLNVGFFISPAIANFAATVFSDGSPASVYLYGGMGSLVLAACIALIVGKFPI